jgi:MoxR-like ATPase
MANGLDRVLLYGKPGTGKTYFGLNYHLGTSKSYRLICTDEMTDGDMIGKYKQNDNGIWRFEEGVAIKAWRTGGRLVVDEINRVNGDIEARLMAIIDTVASSSFEHPETGEIIRPAQGFSVVATMNGEPDDLSPAVLDRLVVRVEIEQPHPDAIAALPAELRDIALEYSMRDDADRYSLRSFFAFAGLLKSSGNLEASARVCLPRIANSIVGALAITQSESVQNIARPESAQNVSTF